MLTELLAHMFRTAQDQLLAAPVGDLTAMQAHAKMLALRDIRNALQSYVDDAKVILKGEV